MLIRSLCYDVHTPLGAADGAIVTSGQRRGGDGEEPEDADNRPFQGPGARVGAFLEQRLDPARPDGSGHDQNRDDSGQKDFHSYTGHRRLTSNRVDSAAMGDWRMAGRVRGRDAPRGSVLQMSGCALARSRKRAAIAAESSTRY